MLVAGKLGSRSVQANQSKQVARLSTAAVSTAPLPLLLPLLLLLLICLQRVPLEARVVLLARHVLPLHCGAVHDA